MYPFIFFICFDDETSFSKKLLKSMNQKFLWFITQLESIPSRIKCIRVSRKLRKKKFLNEENLCTRQYKRRGKTVSVRLEIQLQKKKKRDEEKSFSFNEWKSFFEREVARAWKLSFSVEKLFGFSETNLVHQNHHQLTKNLRFMLN